MVDNQLLSMESLSSIQITIFSSLIVILFTVFSQIAGSPAAFGFSVSVFYLRSLYNFASNTLC